MSFNPGFTILFVSIFSGLGIRILQFQGQFFVWSAVIILILSHTIIKVKFHEYLAMIVTIILILLIFFLRNDTFPFFLISVIICATLVASFYHRQPHRFISDLNFLSEIAVVMTLFSIPVLVLFQPLFTKVYFGYYDYYTFLGVFWFTTKGGFPLFDGLRFTGFAWEPGIWQYFINMKLLFAIWYKPNPTWCLMAIFCSLIMYTTTSYITTAYILTILLFMKIIKLRVVPILALLLLSIVAFPVVSTNYQMKINGEHSGSGMTRVSDTVTGAYLVATNLTLGISQEEAIAVNNPEILPIKAALWRGNYTDGSFEAYLTVPNSNGFFIFLFDWGILGLLLVFLATKSQLLREQNFPLMFAFWGVMYLTFAAEPISRTIFYYIFIISGLSTFIERLKWEK